MADPIFVFDDDCGFCTWWAEWFGARTDMDIVGFTDLDPELRERLPLEFEQCSHVVTNERVYSCGASIEEALLRTRTGSFVRPIIEGFRHIGPYRMIREWAYRRGANNRDVLGRVLSKTPPAREDADRS